MRWTSRVRRTVVLCLALGCSESATGPVETMPSGIRVSVPAARLESLGDTIRLSATIVDAQGIPMPGLTVTWRVEGDSVLSAAAEDGAFVAQRNGSTRVWAELSEVSGRVIRGRGYVATLPRTSVDVVVAQRPAGAVLSAADTTLWALGARVQLRASISDARGNPLLHMTDSIAFSTANPAIATVSADGIVRAVSDGVVRITASVREVTVHLNLSVSSTFPVNVCADFAQSSGATCAAVQLTATERVP